MEDFVTDHPDALTANIGELGFKSILHVIGELLVDVESDEATCLVDKLASTLDLETVGRQDHFGQTALSFLVAKGNLKALISTVGSSSCATTLSPIFFFNKET